MIREVCVDSVGGVRAAKEAGAERVELCANLMEGGITPSLGMIRRARSVDGIALNVIVRPRGGDFYFDADEHAEMQTDIDAIRSEGADGVVIGCLEKDGTIDVPRTRALIERARPLAVTFHRAFDMTPDPFAALETLVELGVDRVLTSGQEASVLAGLPLLRELMERAGDRIIVMPGGDISERSVERILRELSPKEIHFAAMEMRPSEVTFRRTHVFMGGTLRPPEYDRPTTTVSAVRAVVSAGSKETSG